MPAIDTPASLTQKVIAGGLAVAFKDERHRDAAAMTFLVTLSGLQMAGIGAAFWGVVAGVATLAVHNSAHPRSASGDPPEGGTASGPAKPDPRRPLGSALPTRDGHIGSSKD